VTITDDARVSIILADYANQDAVQKINILGGGWQITAVGPNGLTAEQAVVVFIEVPPQYRGDQFAAGLSLVNEAGDPVQFPGPDGQLQALRIQQLVRVDPPVTPGVHIPGHVPSRAQLVTRLGNGLPLAPGQLYTWIFEIDGNPKASISFFVAGPPPGPVIG
jgi:hypothetical protein